MKFRFLIYFSFFLLRAYSQNNLVINPGFEIVSSPVQTYGELYKAIGWHSPVSTNSDLFSLFAPPPYVSIPSAYLGYFYQYPKTGNNFAGILAFRIDWDPNLRQYIQGKLNDTLERKKKYNIEYYTNLCNGCVYTINNLGVYFSNDSFFVNSPYSLVDTPQVVNPSSNPLIDTLNWIKVSGTYVAKGGEKYLTIGCFSAALGLDTIRISSTPPCTPCQQAYYSIDDVSVSLWDSTIAVNDLVAENRVKVFPNPAENYFAVRVPLLNADVTIELYDVLGYMQRKEKLRSEITNFSTEQFGNGFYFYKIFDDLNVLTEGKLIIAK
jgi:hypothetical protein